MNHILTLIIYISIYFGVSAHCQGGGGGEGEGSSGGRYYRGGSSCNTGKCRQIGGIIAGSVIGGILGLLVIVFGIIFCYKCFQSRPIQQNSEFIQLPNLNGSNYESSEINIFRSGIWSSIYYQYGSEHGPYEFSLIFDPQSMKVTGRGSDDVGTFTIDGDYSITTQRLGLTKIYEAGTSNPQENLGHQVIIQVTWNAQTDQFEGKWYVQTYKYRGEDYFELKFKQDDLPPIYEET